MHIRDCHIRSLILALLCVICVGSAQSLEADTIGNQAVMRISEFFDADSIVIPIEAEVIDSVFSRSTFLINLPESLTVSVALTYLRNHPGVETAYPNFQVRFPEPYQISQSFPDQNHPPYLSGVSPESYYTQADSFNIGLAAAQQLADGSSLLVAVIDNGLAYDHPLFDSCISRLATDLVDGDDLPEEVQGTLYGHGTFVSGLIRLTAPEATILPIRVFDTSGYSSSFYIASAVWAAIDAGADAINMSFGSYDSDALIASAVTDAASADIIMVAAAGNDSTSTPAYPAALPEVIAVSALDASESPASWTNYGPHISLSAPGVDVYSALPGEYSWGTWSGTSFAAPIVTGAATLLKHRQPELTADEIVQSLQQSARTDLNSGTISPPQDYYGWGQVDALNAILAWSRGDSNGDNEINVTDLTVLIDFLFRAGPQPTPSELLADNDCTGELDVSDITVLVDFLFRGGTIVLPCYD